MQASPTKSAFSRHTEVNVITCIKHCSCRQRSESAHSPSRRHRTFEKKLAAERFSPASRNGRPLRCKLHVSLSLRCRRLMHARLLMSRARARASKAGSLFTRAFRPRELCARAHQEAALLVCMYAGNGNALLQLTRLF